MLTWIKSHWVSVVFLVSILFAGFLGYQSLQDTRDAQVTRCKVAAPRTAYLVYFQYSAAKARRESGDLQIAKEYQALGDATITTIAAPPGFENSPELVEVQFVRQEDGTLRAHLTDKARSLQEKGCEAAYK